MDKSKTALAPPAVRAPVFPHASPGDGEPEAFDLAGQGEADAHLWSVGILPYSMERVVIAVSVGCKKYLTRRDVRRDRDIEGLRDFDAAIMESPL